MSLPTSCCHLYQIIIGALVIPSDSSYLGIGGSLVLREPPFARSFSPCFARVRRPVRRSEILFEQYFNIRLNVYAEYFWFFLAVVMRLAQCTQC